MTKPNLKEIQATADKFNNDVVAINKELKRIASVKTRLKKQKGRSDYDEKMTATLSYYQILVEAKNLLEPKEKPVTMYVQEDVDRLDYDETVKAIRSIQSKKTLSRWLTDVDGDNDEYRNACKIEAMLVEHRSKVKPVDSAYVRKSDIMTIVDVIESSGKLSQDTIVSLLMTLVHQETSTDETLEDVLKEYKLK